MDAPFSKNRTFKRKVVNILSIFVMLAMAFPATGSAYAEDSTSCVPPPSGMTGWWPGDDNFDDIVAGRDGIPNGNLSIGPGMVGQAFHLDGDGDFLEVADAPELNFGTGDFTVDLWVYFNDTANEQVLIEKWIQGDPVYGWTLTKLAGNSLRFAAVDENRNDINLDSGELDLSPGFWYHFAVTRQGSAVTLYMNGAPIAQNAAMGIHDLSSPSSIKFGHRGNPYDTPGSHDYRDFYLNGRIDEAEIFTGTALSGEQIMELYKAGSAGKCKDITPPQPAPWIRAHPEWNNVDGWYWPLGATLTLTIDDPNTDLSPDIKMSRVVDVVSDPPENYSMWFDLPGYDLKPGDIVKMTDGTTERSLVVSPVEVMSIDLDTATVRGKAEANADIRLPIPQEVNVTADEGGNWQAHFADGLWRDLMMIAEDYDDDGDLTSFEHYISLYDGEHLGTEGIAHANFCDASGWAEDLDDLRSEVEVRVLVDGIEFAAAETQGHEFYFNLWGIQTYVEHQVTAQVYDGETNTWKDLGGTPKPLTCVNYDIYMLNVKNGKVERLTSLENTGEYNPSWSQDGKKIVHDVADAESHALYITDVRTGISTPLPGGDPGNDAVWSPNGKWIVFDRRWFGEPNLYLLPPAGGEPQLVVEDAVNADWSPDGLRLVFERGGGIWTDSLTGGEGQLIVEAGSNPVWSPDGLWIAYDLDGDLWKIGVDESGARSGEPIQLTSGPVNEGGPTWSKSGEYIAFTSTAAGDEDIWKIPAEGGTPIQLRGAVGFGDYDPAYSNNGQFIAYEGATEPVIPHIESDTWLDYYALVDWPVGQAINISIDDPATKKQPDYRTAFTPDGTTNWYSFQPGLDLKPGFEITAQSRYFTKKLVISNLAATNVDAVNGMVSGVATPNNMFYMVTVGDYLRLPIGLDVMVDENGSWVVDFKDYEIPPLPWTWFIGGEMMEWDQDGDMSHARWHVQQEVVEVWLVQNEIWALDWPRDVTLKFSVFDPETGLTHDYFAGTEPQDWFDGTMAIVNPGDLQLKPGMTVLVTDGNTAKSTVIQDIKITNIGVDSDLVYGYAPPDASLQLGAWEDSPVFRFFNADGDGNWMVNYREPSINGVTVDLYPGQSLRLYMREDDQDSTVWENYVPNPHFSAFPEWEYIEGWEWPLGVNVHLAIDDPATETNPDFEQDQQVVVTPWDPNGWWVMFNFSGQYDMKVGDVVTLTDGITTRIHTIRNLAVTAVDKDANTVYGTADPGAMVNVWPHGYGELIPTAGEDGAWQADFNSIGTDLVEGMGGRTEVRDDFGNATAVEWRIPNPHFSIFPKWDYIEAWDFPEGATVYATVEGKLACSLEEKSVHPDWDPNALFAGLWLPEECDVVVDDIVTVTDHVTTRQYRVQNLAITAIDKEANTIAGTADPGAMIHVWPHGYGELLPTADAKGEWFADFDDIGIDLVEGMGGRTEVRDESGNATAVEWRIPGPARLVVQITENWFRVENFTPITPIGFKIYDGDSLLLEGSTSTDWDGTVTHWVGAKVDLVPGNKVIVTDGVTTREIVLEDLKFEVFNLANGQLSGTAPAPFGRDVWVGIGWHDQDAWMMDVNTDAETGAWLADFDKTVPADYWWVAAQIFDGDGDASELRPAWVVNALYVTGTEDILANDGVCTLREAVIAANTNSPSGDADGECPAGVDSQTDIVILAADQTYSLTIDSTCGDDQACGDLDIGDNSAATDLIMMVEGNGAATISQDAVVDDRVLENHSAGVQIEGLTLTGGTAGWAGGGLHNYGSMIVKQSTITANSSPNAGAGGISNDGSMTILSSTVSNNTSVHDGGGIGNTGTLIIDSSILSGNAGKGGGALSNGFDGTITIQNGSEISGNSGETGGALFNYGILNVVDSTVSGNQAGYGGGLSNWAGTITLTNSTVTGNTSANDGGGIHNSGSATTIIEDGSVISGNTSQWNGGGLTNWDDGTVTIRNSTVSNNTTSGAGGGLSNHNQGKMTIEGSSISNNSANGSQYSSGGGIVNWGATMALTNSTVSENTTVWGGGIMSFGGSLTLDASTVSDNAAANGGGGIFIKESTIGSIQNGSQIVGNTATWSAGISSWTSTLTIDASIVSGNTAVEGGGGMQVQDGGTVTVQNGSIFSDNSAKNGGGISNWGPSVLIIDASTLSGNWTTSQSGGGLWNSGNAQILASTISGNNAEEAGGGIFNWNGTLTVTGSALLANTANGEGDAVYNVTDTMDATAVSNSCIVGNGSTAVFNESSASQNFISNWWGDASGPGGVGTGSGDSVGINIAFDPWLLAPPDICTP